jgi:hypothetical protein
VKKLRISNIDSVAASEGGEGVGAANTRAIYSAKGLKNFRHGSVYIPFANIDSGAGEDGERPAAGSGTQQATRNVNGQKSSSIKNTFVSTQAVRTVGLDNFTQQHDSLQVDGSQNNKVTEKTLMDDKFKNREFINSTDSQFADSTSTNTLRNAKTERKFVNNKSTPLNKIFSSADGNSVFTSGADLRNLNGQKSAFNKQGTINNTSGNMNYIVDQESCTRDADFMLLPLNRDNQVSSYVPLAKISDCNNLNYFLRGNNNNENDRQAVQNKDMSNILF